MIAETISETANPRTKVILRIKSANLDSPRSAEAMEATLLAHVLECRHCLAFALFDGLSLAETGCDRYKRMLSQMKTELRVHAALEIGAHVSEEAIEEYCFNRLPEPEAASLEEHMSGCEECASRLEYHREFIHSLKAALVDWAAEAFVLNTLNGVLGIHAPEFNFSLCAPIVG